jgi:hypothetical protein
MCGSCSSNKTDISVFIHEFVIYYLLFVGFDIKLDNDDSNTYDKLCRGIKWEAIKYAN